MRLEPPEVHDARRPVDERLVAPEQRYEAHEGRLVYVAPADEPHGTRHSELLALLEAHTSDEYDVACDMLTRTSELDDVAPDASIFPQARDPKTGGRQLEHLAFEVVSTSGLASAGVKAQRLVDRGVRRVFAIDVKHQRLLEWAADAGIWQIASQQGELEDRTLAVPLPVAALVGAARNDDAVASALLRRRNPVLVAAVAQAVAEGKAAAVAEGKAAGKVEATAEAVVAILVARGLAPSPAQAARLRAERDSERLDRWLVAALTATSVDQLLAL